MIEDQVGVANVREIAKELRSNKVGAVLWAGHTDLAVSYFDDEQAVSKAIDKILAAGKEFDIPVAVNGFANVKAQMAQGARVFISGGPTSAAAAAKRETGR
jgi:4-hydroxy-2-oxoheptanedioate aldolase